MTKEALRLALEALSDLSAWNDGEVGGHMDEPYSAEVARRTITAIKKVLAQPEQEPVAWGVFEGNLHDMFFSPSEAQEMADLKGTHAEVRPLYTTPPQRKPLTDEEIWKFWWARPEVTEGEDDSMEAEFVAAVRAVLAAHGIKE